MPTQQVRHYTHKRTPWPVALSLSHPVSTSMPEERETEPALPLRQPRPMLFITLAVKAKYEHTYEYMNNWTSGYCYSPARTLPSLQSLLFGACSSAEHGLSDRMSEVGQRGVGAQVLLSGSFTEKEWPVSANAPSVCLRSFLPCPCALFLRWLPCWHKDLPFAQMADSRGPPPPQTHTHFLSQWSAAPLSVSEMHLWPICPNEKED